MKPVEYLEAQDRMSFCYPEGRFGLATKHLGSYSEDIRFECKPRFSGERLDSPSSCFYS